MFYLPVEIYPGGKGISIFQIAAFATACQAFLALYMAAFLALAFHIVAILFDVYSHNVRDAASLIQLFQFL